MFRNTILMENNPNGSLYNKQSISRYDYPKIGIPK